LAARRFSLHIAASVLAVSGVVALGLAAGLLLFRSLIPIQLVTPTIFWTIPVGAAFIAMPLTFWQARHWRLAMRRFDEWESLDLDEQIPA
jgi:hypothetical protein